MLPIYILLLAKISNKITKISGTYTNVLNKDLSLIKGLVSKYSMKKVTCGAREVNDTNSFYLISQIDFLKVKNYVSW